MPGILAALRRRRRAGLLGAGALLLVAAAAFEAARRSSPPQAEALGGPDAAAFPESWHPERLAKVGPETCIECHAEEVGHWQGSHHALANRPVSVERDRAAFTPERRVVEGGVTYELSESEGAFRLRVVREDGSSESYDLVGVIGEYPLRQYLAAFPGGRLQAVGVAYAVDEDRWFDVFEGEGREPGEWGHWTGQGMNWNANCAACHMTEYDKGYDFESDAYASSWLAQGVSCASCHDNLEGHAAAAREGDHRAAPLPSADPGRAQQTCAACHSRRDELVAGPFGPGDAFHDRFALSLPDQPGLYHPDGQVRDEVFAYGSFRMSRMGGHAGISCMECHDPHALDTKLPVRSNALCLDCHAGGREGAPIVEPEAHSFHPAGSAGARCVACHMPETAFMQIDERADHGFTHPDPLLTKELGVPNACGKCHDDRGVDWAVEWAERWYGDRLEGSRQRRRARALAAAYAGEGDAVERLRALSDDEDVPAWRAAYAGLLAGYLPDGQAAGRLEELLDDDSPLVRARAAGGLGAADALRDEVRSVRLAAARALAASGRPVPDEGADAEWLAYLRLHADRPMSLFLLADRAVREGRRGEARKRVDRALALDRKNPEAYRQAAILLSSAGMNGEAGRRLREGWKLAPGNALFPYSLGLLAAEEGALEVAVEWLERAVELQPDFPRAWRNLAIAYGQLGRAEDARRAQRRAQEQGP